MSADTPDLIGFEEHDHRACITRTLAAADALCASKRLRLTPVRRKVLELLLQEHRALGAYAILDLLRDAGFGSQPAVAYRALSFLAEHGLVHRIERLNAFVACTHPGESHAPAFMICRLCDAVAEVEAAPARVALGAAAQSAKFQIEKTVLEAEGLCPSCAGEATA